MALRTVGVKLAAEVSSYVGGLRTARTATKDFVGELNQAAKAGQLDAVADRAAHMGLALGAAFAGVVAITAKFDKQMSEVGAVANASAADLDRLRQAALQAGKDTAFSATEAAKAEAELAKAGLSTSEILGGALSGSLSLAAAGSLDLAESADIAAKTMNVFQLEGEDVGHIADVLAAAANKSATDVHEMGEALRMGGLAAKSSGMSLEETVGTLSAFADRALVGSDAGTSLKTMLQMLAAPSEKASNLMEQLGIHAYDAGGNFIGTTKLAAELQRALGNLTQEQRNAAMATIFGADAMRAANVLFEVGEQGIKDYTAAVDDQGAAAEVAAKKMDNLAGDIERLKGSLETLAIEAGSDSSSGLRRIVQGADRLVESVSNIPGPVQSAGVMIAGLSGAMLLAAAGAAKMRAASARASEQLAEMGPQGERAAKGLDRASRAAGRVGVALAALNVASAIGGSSLNAQIEGLTLRLDEFAESGAKGGEVARLFGEDMGKLDTAMKDVADTGMWSSFARGLAGTIEGLTGLGNVFDDSLQKNRERIDALDQALAQMVRSGNAETAKQAFDRIAASAAEQGVSVTELMKVLPGYASALDTAATSSGNAATAIGGVGTAAGMTAEQVQELKDAFDRLFGIQMDLDRAVIAYKEGIAELNEELRTGARTTNTNTEEGRKNASAVLDQIDNIKDLRQARIDHGMSLADANAAYQKDIRGLQASMRAAGFTEEQIKTLTDAYYKVPDEVSTTVKANTATATTKLETFKKKYIGMDGKVVTVTVRVTQKGDYHIPGQGTLVKDRWGGIEKMASGGRIPAHTVSSPTVLYGERATGEEAYIPKFGDMARSRAIWEYVGENWLGMNAQAGSDWSGYRPMMAASAGPSWSATPLRIQGNAMADTVFEWLRNEVRRRGGELAVLNLKAPA